MVAEISEAIILKYIGNGAFVIGIPAKDLTAAEVKEYGGVVALVATGLYERVAKEPEMQPAKASKATKELPKDGK